MNDAFTYNQLVEHIINLNKYSCVYPLTIQSSEQERAIIKLVNQKRLVHVGHMLPAGYILSEFLPKFQKLGYKEIKEEYKLATGFALAKIWQSLYVLEPQMFCTRTFDGKETLVLITDDKEKFNQMKDIVEKLRDYKPL